LENGELKKVTMPKGIEGRVTDRIETHYYDSDDKLTIVVGYGIEWDWFGSGKLDGTFHESMVDVIDEKINLKSNLINKTGRIRK